MQFILEVLELSCNPLLKWLVSISDVRFFIYIYISKLGRTARIEWAPYEYQDVMRTTKTPSVLL